MQQFNPFFSCGRALHFYSYDFIWQGDTSGSKRVENVKPHWTNFIELYAEHLGWASVLNYQQTSDTSPQTLIDG